VPYLKKKQLTNTVVKVIFFVIIRYTFKELNPFQEYYFFAFNILALMATIIVLKLISTAPAAGSAKLPFYKVSFHYVDAHGHYVNVHVTSFSLFNFCRNDDA
jgi:hypothetical protein